MNDRFSKLHPLIQARRSGRTFTGEPVSKEQLELLLEAARWAPSCSNLQPWRYLVVTQPGALEKLHAALAGGNAWAKQAPALIAVLSKEDLDKVAPDGRKYYLFDTGLGTQNLILQAVSMGLMCHVMAGFDPQKAKEALGVPAAFTAIALLAVGYPGDAVDDERKRKSVQEIAAFERWDERLD